MILACPLCNVKVCDPDEAEEKYTRSRSLEVHPRVVSIEDVETISMKESGYRDYKYAYLEDTSSIYLTIASILRAEFYYYYILRHEFTDN